MDARTKVRLILLGCAVAVLAAFGARAVTFAGDDAGQPVAAAAPTTTSTTEAPDPFTTALESQGFTVTPGEMSKFDLIPICCSGQTPSCMANNAGAPYMAGIIPPAPGQVGAAMLPYLFKLGPNEAIVVVGRTPPPVKYFSYEPFANIVHAHGTGEPQVLGANIGDTVNNLTIRTSGTADDPYDKDMILIVTADEGVDSRVRAAVAAAGLRPDIVNTNVIPSATVRLGVDENADQFSLLHRMFLPESQEALDAYMNTPKVALRVTLTDGFTPTPFPTPDLRVRGTGQTEMDLLPAVEDLRSAIIERYPDHEAVDLTTSVWLQDSFDGLQRGINVYLPTRDTIYFRTDPLFTLPADPGTFVVAYGVNHARTSKATYANLSVYADPNLLLGVVGENNQAMAGSAGAYIPEHPQVDSLYAWRVSRACNGEAGCLQVQLNQPCQKLTIDDETQFWLAFRVYLEQRTRVGPHFGELVYDRALLFRPKTAG